MIPEKDRAWHIKRSHTYVYAIWEHLVKEHGRYIGAHFQALLKEFDLAKQSDTENIHEYVFRLTRLSKDLEVYDYHVDPRL